jgi:hypothetical protein
MQSFEAARVGRRLVIEAIADLPTAACCAKTPGNMREMQLRHGGPGLGTRVILAGTVIVSGTLLASGCSSSGSSTSAPASGSASGPAPAASSGSSAPAPSGPATSSSSGEPTAPASPAASSPSVNPGGTEVGTQTCAQKAEHAFIQVTKVVSAADGGLTVTGNKATIVCGGPDDFHFNVASDSETGHVQPGADIEVFPVTKMAQEKIAASELASYLATDEDTKIFLIGGSLSAISSLQEQFHP